MKIYKFDRMIIKRHTKLVYCKIATYIPYINNVEEQAEIRDHYKVKNIYPVYKL